MTLDPRRDVSQITLNDPQLAVPLLDFLLWAVTPKVTDSAEYNEILDTLYAKVPDFRIHREEYVESRIGELEFPELGDHHLDEHVSGAALTRGGS